MKKFGGWNATSELFVLKVIPAIKDTSRAGFIVSTKVDNRATERNRIKRQLREVTRTNLKLFKQPVELLVVVKPKCKNVPTAIVKSDYLALLRRARVL
jgi:ribonuclease P protein component